MAVTGILCVDRLQILANPHFLFWNTRFISDILKERMKKRKATQYHSTAPSISGKGSVLLSKRIAKTRQNSDRFLKLPNTRGEQNP